MRKGKWTEPELATLRELYDHTVADEIADRLDRPVAGVYFQVQKLGLLKQGATAGDIQYKFATADYRRCPGCGAKAKLVSDDECLSCHLARTGRARISKKYP